MNLRILHSAAAWMLTSAVVFVPALRAETAYAVDSRALLVTFDTRLPSFVTSVRLIRGLQPGEGILGIDFRPANRRLYALGSSSRLYTINPETGDATAVGTGPFTPALDGTEFGFDFNPTVDRIRVVSNRGQNLRLHPDTGAVAAVDGAINYADGTAPGAVAAAYTNNFAGATSTQLYVLDARNRTLTLQSPPNDGRLTTVGPLVNLDISDVAGFDVSPNSGSALAVVRFARSNKIFFYEIHLPTGDYNPLGEIPFFEQMSGLAIAPE